MTDSPRTEPLLRISYVGLGNIGLPVAQNLVNYNPRHQLKVWNRTKEKYNLLDAYGCDHIEELLSEEHAWVSDDRRSDENPKWSDGVHVIFTSLVNDEVALEVYEKLMAAARKMEEGARVVFVDQSTLHPDTAAQLEKQTQEPTAGSKITYLASPVIGQPAAAAARQLVSIVAGDQEAIAYVKPILDSIGRANIVLGEDNTQASRLKLFINMMLYESIQVFSEVYALADATGFPADKLHQVFVIPAPPLLNYSNKISKGLFDGSTGFKIDGGLKDTRLILSMRDRLSHPLPLPTLERVQASLQEAKDLPEGAGGSMGVEALSAITRKNGGMKPFMDGSDLGQQK